LRAGRRQAYLAEKFLGSALSAQDRVLSPSFSAGAMHTGLFGIPIEFMVFAVTLLGVAFFHRHVLAVAVGGLVLILVYQPRRVCAHAVSSKGACRLLGCHRRCL